MENYTRKQLFWQNWTYPLRMYLQAVSLSTFMTGLITWVLWFADVPIAAPTGLWAEGLSVAFFFVVMTAFLGLVVGIGRVVFNRHYLFYGGFKPTFVVVLPAMSLTLAYLTKLLVPLTWPLQVENMALPLAQVVVGGYLAWAVVGGPVLWYVCGNMTDNHQRWIRKMHEQVGLKSGDT